MLNQSGNRTEKFVKNIAGSAVLQTVTVITGFISPRLMLEAFGSEINGIVSSITQFISYLTLVEAGLSNATIFALYKPLAEKDNESRDSIISAAKIAYYRIGFLFVVLSVILSIIYPFIGHTDELTNLELGVLVLVLCCNSTFNFFVLAKYRTLLTADQCGYIVSLASSAQLLLHLIIITIAIKLNFSVIVVRVLGIISLFIASIILATVVRIKYGKINYKATPNMNALDKRWDAMFLQITGVVIASFPVVAMTRILDYKTISVYTIYNMIAGSVSSCITVFTSGLSASFGNIYALGDKELLKKTTNEFRTIFYMMITIMYSVMLTMILPFVSLYVDGINDVNYLVPLLGVFITLKGVIDNFKAPHGMLIYSSGKFKSFKRITLMQAILTVILSIVMTYMFGVIGSTIAVCLVNAYVLIEMLILTPRELVEMSIVSNVRQIVQSFIVMGCVYGIYHMFNFKINTYSSWIIVACIMCLISTVLTIGVYFLFDRKDLISLSARIKSIFIMVRRKRRY